MSRSTDHRPVRHISGTDAAPVHGGGVFLCVAPAWDGQKKAFWDAGKIYVALHNRCVKLSPLRAINRASTKMGA